jgi:hypothetical protein
MSDQRRLVSPEHFHPDPYTRSQTAERILNAAIVQAEISRSFEEYLEIFDEFYAHDVEVSSESLEETIRGKARVRPLLLNFLVPLHVKAEVGGMSISIRESSIPGDAPGEMHSNWTLDLVGVSGKTCTLSWRTFRKWSESRVVLERHYDQQQSGSALTFDDFRLDSPEGRPGIKCPHNATC